MDNLLVEGGHKLNDLMTKSGIPPRAVMWVHNTDVDTWRLWVVPPKNLTNKLDFYRRVSSLVTKNRNELRGLDAADIEMIEDTHPAIKALSTMFRVTGRSDVRVSQNMLNGFYLPDGIILQMDLNTNSKKH